MLWTWTAFTLGLFGSLHCLGMCGPIAMTLPLTNKEKRSVFKQSLIYNLGRVSSYTFLGLIMGLLGWGVYIAGYQKSLSVILGAVLILASFFTVSLESQLFRIGFINKVFEKIKSTMSTLMYVNANSNAYKIGLVNGVLPCGMVYIALAGALTSGGLIEGAVYMTLFGLGTLPMMMGIMLFSNFNKNFILKFRKWIPLIMFLFGLLLIKRGLALEIPLDFSFWQAEKFPIMCH